MLKHVIVSQWQWPEPPAQPLARLRNNLPFTVRPALWTSLTLVTLVLCLATLGGFFGRFSGLLELSSHFRWQYCLVLLVTAILFAAAGKRRPAIVAGLFSLVNLGFIVPFYVPTVAPSPQSHTYRALMLNVLYANDDYDSVKALIETADPDFFVLVEVTEAWAAAMHSVAAEYPYVSRALFDDYEETVLYSRFPFATIRTSASAFVGRPPVVATLDVEGQPLTVIGAHPNAPKRPSRVAVRNRQLAAIAHLAAGESGPLLLVGDLNITPWSPFFHDFLAATGLRNGRYGFGIQPSWPAQLPPLSIPIDHALASPEVTVHNFKTGPSVGSDHYPIIVDFSIHPESQLAQR